MLKMRSINLVAVITMLLLSTGVYAKEISYDYVGAGYASYTDSSLGFDLDGNAYALAGSFSLAPMIALTASYENDSFDRYLGYKLTGSAFQVGVTAHTSVTPSADVYGNFSVINAKVDLDYNGTNVASDSDTGNVITVGFRAMASNQLEFEVSGSRTDVFGDTSNSFTVGLNYYANNRLSIGAGYLSSDNLDGYVLSIRYDTK